MSDKSNNLPIINVNISPIGDLSKPASKFVDLIKKVWGDYMDPDQILARAAAHSEARTIQKKGRIKNKDVSDRFNERRKKRRQKNIESITLKASERMPLQVTEKMPNEDWVWQFYEHAKDVSDDEMQNIWANLLAGEVAAPGKYSLVTLARVKTMTPRVANFFTEILSCAWKINDEAEVTLLTNTSEDKRAGDNCFDLDKVRCLELHGLVHYLEHGSIPLFLVYKLHYYGKSFNISFHAKDDLTEYLSTNAALTEVGKELVSIAGGKPNVSYMEDVFDNIKMSDRSGPDTEVIEIIK